MRNSYGFRQDIRRFWTQTEQRYRRSHAEAGTRGREADCLSQQRSGARNPRPLYQGSAGSGGQALPAGQLYGPEKLQVAVMVLVAALFLGGCAAHKRPEQSSVPPPPPPAPAAPATPPVVTTEAPQPQIAVQ